jgi:uncharacterized protein
MASAMPEAIPVFDDPYAITIADHAPDPDEERFVTLGMGALGRLPVVVHTWRGEDIRIISAHPTEAHEREQYEAERWKTDTISAKASGAG